MTRPTNANLKKLRETLALHKLQAAKLLAQKDPLNLNKTDPIDTQMELQEFQKNQPKTTPS